MKTLTTNFRRAMLFLIAAGSLTTLTGRAQGVGGTCNLPAFPDGTITTVQDRDQMECQLGITEPVLPPKLQDPNAPAGSYPVNNASPEGNWTDAAGDTITRTGFGLWNNYDNNDLYRVGQYTPIDLLKMKDGTPVVTPADWWTKRRPEIWEAVQEELYGKIPDRSLWPAITWTLGTVTTGTANGVAYKQVAITGTIDTSGYPAIRNVPRISATLRTPLATAGTKIPVIIVIGAFGFNTSWSAVAPYGYGICNFSQGALQPDSGGKNLSSYIIGLINKGNWRKPDDWGALAAWSWGISRLVDFFTTYPDVDETKIGVEGHSRYGKATLVALAYDPRLLVGMPSCAGSLGTKMNRRHWGQNLENSGWDQEYHWMAGNFFKWQGPLNAGSYMPRKVELMSVDAHSVESLVAPRPIFLNGGTAGDSWQDPLGMYLSGVNATPAYVFLGMKGLINPDPLDGPGGTPRVDVAYIDGDIGYRHHHEGHTDVPDWPTFVQFASLYFNDNWPVVMPGQSFTLGDGVCNVVGTLVGTDPDAHDVLQNWQIKGGSGAAPWIFAIDPATGRLKVANGALLDFDQTSYTLTVTVSDGILTSTDETVTIVIPNKIRLCHNGHTIDVSKNAVAAHLAIGDCIGDCAAGKH